jgi:hypothetical protein
MFTHDATGETVATVRHPRSLAFPVIAFGAKWAIIRSFRANTPVSLVAKSHLLTQCDSGLQTGNSLAEQDSFTSEPSVVLYASRVIRDEFENCLLKPDNVGIQLDLTCGLSNSRDRLYGCNRQCEIDCHYAVSTVQEWKLTCTSGEDHRTSSKRCESLELRMLETTSVSLW